MIISHFRATCKKTIICKHVDSNLLRKDIKLTHNPSVGDVAIFKVKSLGKHIRVQITSGNNSFILPGDYIMAAFGNRYASEQFEGYVPTHYQKEFHILGQGGAIGIVKTMHQRFELIGPTKLSMVGYVCCEKGKVLNTKVLAGNLFKMTNNKPQETKVILSVGSGMDSGKTTSAGFLTRGLKKARRKVVYIKLTGTVYTRDKRFLRDYGADMVLDFSDIGYPSTYLCSLKELMQIYNKLMIRAGSIDPDFIIIEIADGLLQTETKALLSHEEFMKSVTGVLYSSADSLSAVYGSNILTEMGCLVLGITGLLTTSPLLVQEVRSNSRVPVLYEEDLIEKAVTTKLNL